MKTIKIIDLLTDLFDYREFQSEKLPKRIRFNGNTFIFTDGSYYYANGDNIMQYINHTLDLRVQAEILDEEDEFEDIDIKEKTYFDGLTINDSFEYIYEFQLKLWNNQKKIIERLKDKE